MEAAVICIRDSAREKHVSETGSCTRLEGLSFAQFENERMGDMISTKTVSSNLLCVQASCQVSCRRDFDITISGRLSPFLESLIVILGNLSYISAYLFAAFLISVGGRCFETFVSSASLCRVPGDHT